MANSTLFSTRYANVPAATTKNRHGAKAYQLTNKQALAQMASTGCLRDTFYVSAGEQLDMILDLAKEVDSDYLAKVAVYARTKGFMKDSPALLMAILACRSNSEHGTAKEGHSAALFRKAFPLVIDNGKMVRNLVQMLRSGKIDGKTHNLSANTVVRKCIVNLLNSTPTWVLFKWSIGNDPSLADVIRMVHPKPIDCDHAALYQYLLSSTRLDEETGTRRTYFKGNVRYEHTFDQLPSMVQEYEAFKNNRDREVPNVDFRLLDSLELTDLQWRDVALNAPWLMALKNINTFNRHGVFNSQSMVDAVAAKLRNRKLVLESKSFPYQLLVAYLETEGVPNEISEALHDAMEIATEKVPVIDGQVYVLVDISGSMEWSITGHQYAGMYWNQRQQKVSKVRCVDVAALVGASFLRKNPKTKIIPFNTDVRNIRVDARDSIMTNAQRLASEVGGGTNVAAAIMALNNENAKGDLVLVVSDNESWFDSSRARRQGTVAQEEWQKFKKRNPSSKLVCLDIVPDTTTQHAQRSGVLNVGGFSDQVFGVIASFVQGDSADYWVEQIDATVL